MKVFTLAKYDESDGHYELKGVYSSLENANKKIRDLEGITKQHYDEYDYEVLVWEVV